MTGILLSVIRSATARRGGGLAKQLQPKSGGLGPGVVRDTRHATLAAVLMWLLVWRLVIPGFFEYTTNNDDATLEAFTGMVQQEALFNNILWFSLLGFALFIIGSRTGPALALARTLNVYFSLMVVLAGLSVLWSVDPHASTARWSHTVIIMLDAAALALAGGWKPTRFQDVVRPILTSLLTGSLIFGMLYPELAIMPPVIGDPREYWHGLTTHKNELGGIGGTAAVFWIHAWLAKEANIVRVAGGLFVCGACMLLAHSSTAWMATAFVSIFMMLLMRSPPGLRRYMPYIVGAFTVLVLGYALAVLKLVPGLEVLLVPITAMTGKDTTFTDRTKIWEVIEAHIRQSPLLGTGFGGYWVGPDPASASYVFLSILYIYPWESHNGYLDIVNDLGYVGIACLIAYILMFIKQSLRLMPSSRSQAALYLALMFWSLLANLSESAWFKPGWSFVTITAATFALARSLMESRAPGTTPRQRR